MSRRDLDRIVDDLDAELAEAETGFPIDEPVLFEEFDPTDPLATDPTDVLRLEVGLSGLRQAVTGVESLEDEVGPT